MTVTLPIAIPHQDHSQEQAMYASHQSMMNAHNSTGDFYGSSFSSSFPLKQEVSHMMTPQMPISNPIAIQPQRTLSSNVDPTPFFQSSLHPYGSMPDSPLEHLISPTSEEFMMDNYHQSRRFSVSSADPGTPFMHPGHSRSNSYFEGQMVGDSQNWALLQQQMAQHYSMSLPNTFDSPSSSHLPNSDPSTSPTLNQSSGKSPTSHDQMLNGGPKPENEMDKLKLQQIMDKKKRRRENHNAVERRRRDIINEKIQELSTLLPQGLIPSNKCNKGAILRQSVDYIRYLHALLYQQNINPAQLLMAHHANQGMPLESIVEGQCLELNQDHSDAQLVSLQQ
jgi:hypothetical protein